MSEQPIFGLYVYFTDNALSRARCLAWILQAETRRLRAKHKKSHDFDCMMYRQYERQIEELQAENAMYYSDIDELTTDLADVRLDRDELRAEISALKQALKDNTQAFEPTAKALRKENELLHFKHVALAQEIAALKKQLQDITHGIDCYCDDCME